MAGSSSAMTMRGWSSVASRMLLILAFRFEPEDMLPVHDADRVPIEAYMPRHGIGVAPGALHRVFEMQAVAAGRSIERLDRLHREPGHIGLVAAAADAIGNRDLLAGAQPAHRLAHIGQQDQLGRL